MAQGTMLRPLQPDDVEAVVRVDRARSGRARTEFYGRRFRTLADDPAIVGVAAERGGTLAGFALARVLDGEFGAPAPAGVLDSFEGYVHPVDFTGGAAKPGKAWSLFTDAERTKGWKVGGAQFNAVHKGLNRLFVISPDAALLLYFILE